MTAFKPCIVIPSHNHHRALGDIVQALQALGMPVFIVDDGSDAPAREVIAALHAPDAGVMVQRLPARQGKGGAVMAGFRTAAASGFTHAMQIDADGQHDLSAVKPILDLGAAHPDTLVVGEPRYDQSAPLGRRIGRWVTHLWVCVETLSPYVLDTMCGFRLYPLAPTMALLDTERIGRGMEFDTDIIVRLIWRKVPVRTLPVQVRYPAGNHSNFDVWHDNLRISWMHTRLVTRLLLRPFLPKRLSHTQGDASPWFALAERGGYWGLQFLALVYRLAGKRACKAAAAGVGFCFLLSGPAQRRASRDFLRRAYAARGDRREPSGIDLVRHNASFTAKVVESFGAWVSGIDRGVVESSDQAELDRVLARPRGGILIVSHLGNIDLTRAVLAPALRDRVTVLLYTRHAQNFMRLLRRWRPDALSNTFQVDEISPGTIMALRERIDAGGWVAIAGDRVPVLSEGRVSHASFLGREAPFPQGPFILAHLLECPAYLMFCLREKNGYRIHFESFAERIELPRRGKDAALADWANRYARRLEAYTLRDPLQWYNFFDFWATPHPSPVP